MEEGVMIMCGKCGITHGLLQECPSPSQGTRQKKLAEDIGAVHTLAKGLSITQGEGYQVSKDELVQAEARKGREMEKGVIKFKASVWKVGSLGGGGLRVQLNLDQAYIRQMAMLAECQHDPEMELEFEARQSRD